MLHSAMSACCMNPLPIKDNSEVPLVRSDVEINQTGGACDGKLTLFNTLIISATYI